jgi:hypothetical protein
VPVDPEALAEAISRGIVQALQTSDMLERFERGDIVLGVSASGITLYQAVDMPPPAAYTSS